MQEREDGPDFRRRRLRSGRHRQISRLICLDVHPVLLSPLHPRLAAVTPRCKALAQVATRTFRRAGRPASQHHSHALWLQCHPIRQPQLLEYRTPCRSSRTETPAAKRQKGTRIAAADGVPGLGPSRMTKSGTAGSSVLAPVLRLRSAFRVPGRAGEEPYNLSLPSAGSCVLSLSCAQILSASTISPATERFSVCISAGGLVAVPERRPSYRVRVQTQLRWSADLRVGLLRPPSRAAVGAPTAEPPGPPWRDSFREASGAETGYLRSSNCLTKRTARVCWCQKPHANHSPARAAPRKHGQRVALRLEPVFLQREDFQLTTVRGRPDFAVAMNRPAALRPGAARASRPTWPRRRRSGGARFSAREQRARLRYSRESRPSAPGGTYGDNERRNPDRAGSAAGSDVSARVLSLDFYSGSSSAAAYLAGTRPMLVISVLSHSPCRLRPLKGRPGLQVSAILAKSLTTISCLVLVSSITNVTLLWFVLHTHRFWAPRRAPWVFGGPLWDVFVPPFSEGSSPVGGVCRPLRHARARGPIARGRSARKVNVFVASRYNGDEYERAGPVSG
jgi:hypothetical protein